MVGDKLETATLWAKQEGVLAGVPFFTKIFQELGCTVEWKAHEGDRIVLGNAKRIAVAEVKGPVRRILEGKHSGEIPVSLTRTGERTALNLLARASGCATLSRRAFEQKATHKWHGSVAATRKTTPGFKLVEKYAVLVGGCDAHRMDLSSMIMLKDNHVWSTGSITNAVQSARKVGGFSLKIEVECQSYEEAAEAIQAGADVVMLDNFEPERMHETAQRLKALKPAVR